MFKVIIPVNKTTKKVEYFETPRYIFKQTNGVIITTDDASKADGILSADGSVIYSFTNKALGEDTNYTNVDMYEIDTNTYIKETSDNMTSTNDQVTETQTALADVYEQQTSNTDQITEAQTALVDVYEQQASNTDQITEVQTAVCDIYELVSTLTPNTDTDTTTDANKDSNTTK